MSAMTEKQLRKFAGLDTRVAKKITAPVLVENKSMHESELREIRARIDSAYTILSIAVRDFKKLSDETGVDGDLKKEIADLMPTLASFDLELMHALIEFSKKLHKMEY